MVSPDFPPSTPAGVHQGRHLSKYLPVAGWTPTVIARYWASAIAAYLARVSSKLAGY
jgi:hypothetical protein